MLKMSRKAIGCLLSTKPGGDLPSLGIHILTRVSHFDSEEVNTLDLAAEYYDSIQELCDKGLVHYSPSGYRLTDDGRLFLFRIRDTMLRKENGSNSQEPVMAGGPPPLSSQHN